MLSYLQKNKDITSLSNFKTKAFAKYYFAVNSEDDVLKLKEISDFALEKGLKILFVGAGTNILFAFEKFEGILIKNYLQGWEYNSDTKILKSYSNELISNIAESLEKNYMQDLWHRFIGLPGSIGGAIYGNSGCFGLEIENNFLSIIVYNMSTGKIEKFYKNQMNFSYRNSILKENGSKYFLIKTIFNLSTKIEKYSSNIDNIDFRENKQPKGNTCGSFFKNPSREQSAGYLIEQVGLKGYKIGGAYFSEKHANFLMNDGTATYTNLLDLIELAQKKVKEKFDIKFINEVRIIKN